MQNYYILIIILLGVLLIFLQNKENFKSDINSFYIPEKNIFLTDDYYNYINNKPKPDVKRIPLSKLTFDAYLYAKPTREKIICSNHVNRANCWEDNVNNCEWVYRIDGGSYCRVGKKMLL
jgi:hypothetical protein